MENECKLPKRSYNEEQEEETTTHDMDVIMDMNAAQQGCQQQTICL